MADETERAERQRIARKADDRPAAVFQEAPGEAEADAVRDAFIQRAGPAPGQVAAALGTADGAVQARALERLQRERGNAWVQRVVSEAHGTPGRLVGLSQGEMVSEVLQRKDGGAPLAESTRGEMEQHFGADLGDVRVHAGGEAASLNRELDAQAFTVGSDVFFGEGKYDPGSTSGQGLIAHELAHVGQQSGFGAVQRALEEEPEKPKPPEEKPKPEEQEAPKPKPEEEAAKE